MTQQCHCSSTWDGDLDTVPVRLRNLYTAMTSRVSDPPDYNVRRRRPNDGFADNGLEGQSNGVDRSIEAFQDYLTLTFINDEDDIGRELRSTCHVHLSPPGYE